jgi:non-canonical (house-cleaning) NTP pyrophosphatase
MLIVLGSQSIIKEEAVRQALRDLGVTDARLVCVPVSSQVNEQPFGFEETHRGACNRVQQAATLVPDADMAIAIESGLFEEYPGSFFDRAIVVVQLPDGRSFTQTSERVLFPTDAVEEVRRRGEATWTIGKILQERGSVQSHNDPHLSLVGRSRTAFIKDAVVQLLARVLQGSV